LSSGNLKWGPPVVFDDTPVTRSGQTVQQRLRHLPGPRLDDPHVVPRNELGPRHALVLELSDRDRARVAGRLVVGAELAQRSVDEPVAVDAQIAGGFGVEAFDQLLGAEDGAA